VARFFLGAPIAAAAATMSRVGGLLGARAASAAEEAPAAPAEAAPSPLARFLAKQEEDLSSEERGEVRKDVTELEGALKEVRAFVLSNDVPPSGTFRALRSKR
jgi:hypothetical protein